MLKKINHHLSFSITFKLCLKKLKLILISAESQSDWALNVPLQHMLRSCSGRAAQNHLPRATSRWHLSTSEDGGSTASLDNVRHLSMDRNEWKERLCSFLLSGFTKVHLTSVNQGFRMGIISCFFPSTSSHVNDIHDLMVPVHRVKWFRELHS